MTDPLVVHTSELRKAYGAVDALRGLDLAVPAGSIFGFLGRNGAGKTTTLKVLLGMARPTAGQARVFGLDATDARASVTIRQRAAFVTEDKDLIEYMTVDEIVAFTMSFFPHWDRDLEERYRRRFDLRRDQRVRTLSRGARSKLALTLALCRGADLLLLDEPTSGLDPAAADEVLQAIVSHVAARPLTVLFSSHQLAEVDQIADHVAIIDDGRIVACDAPANLLAALGPEVLELRVEQPERAEHLLVDAGVAPEDILAIGTTVTVVLHEHSGEGLVEMLRERSFLLRSVTTRRPAFDDVYLRLTGGRIGTDGQ